MTLIVTSAGLAASLDAAEKGIKLKIKKIGFGSAGYVPNKDQTSLKDEFLRTDFTDSSISSNTLNMNVVFDDLNQSFDAREVGYYLEDETLFAVDSLNGAILSSKHKGAILTESFEIVLSDHLIDSITVDVIGVSRATENNTGIAKIATIDEAFDVENDVDIVTPKKMHDVLDERVVNPNLFINGDFSVWQRPYPNTIGGYCADRWQVRGVSAVGGKQDIYTAVGSAGFPHRYLMLWTTGATSSTYLEQKIKVDAPMRWTGEYTLSFKTDNSYALPDSILNVGWREIGSGADASTVLSVPMPLLGGVQQNVKTITLPKIENFSTSKKYMLVVQVSSGSAPPDGKQRIAEMKFEEGSVATPFIADDESVNLSKCQRYYEVINIGRNLVGADISGQLSVFSEFSVAKHSAPSVSIQSFLQFIPTVPSSAKRTSLNLVSSNPSVNSLQLLMTGDPTLPAFQIGLIYMTVIADAEI